jgi:hypothetical protein
MSRTLREVAPPIDRSGRPGLWGTALAVVALAALYGGWCAWSEDRHRRAPLDLDGWGALVTQLKADGRFATLFSSPSLWKGPVVPFVFGLCYYLALSDWSVLIFNVAAFAVAAGCFYLGFCSFGLSRRAALAAVLLWVLYWPHHMIFGYYYAEPFLALVLAVLFLLTRLTVSGRRPSAALLTGLVSGVLLLARAPFFLGVVGLAVFLWCHGAAGARRRIVFCWAVGFALAFFPWTVRNFLTYGELIPFTTEGGKILFQGTYLPGDGLTMNELRQMPEFAALEKREGDGAIEQYRYWRSLAIPQVRQDPLGQLRLGVRKAIRFWTYLPGHSWLPGWKTAALAALLLPLALAGVVLGRRQPLVQLCALWVGGLWVFHTLVHAEFRYNFPVLPLLGALAVVGAGHLARRFGPAQARPAAKPHVAEGVQDAPLSGVTTGPEVGQATAVGAGL